MSFRRILIANGVRKKNHPAVPRSMPAIIKKAFSQWS
jgi:hypothetical protein